MPDCPICEAEDFTSTGCADCGFRSTDEAVAEISSEEVKQDKGKRFSLLDVRTQEEFDAYNIEGSRLIPLHTLAFVYEDFEISKPLVLYCNNGKKSSLAARFLQQKGFNVKVLHGGLEAFIHKEGKSLPEDESE